MEQALAPDQTKMRYAQFLTILLMCILTGIEVDLFVPSFPELQSTFGLSPFMVELTLGVNLTAHCITSFLIGNLGDRYGRKPVILIGLLIFILGSLFCIFAGQYWQLLFGRFLQGVGISAPAVLSYLIIADMYSVEDQQRMMGVLNGTITMAMAFAPVIGSYISFYFHWQGSFILFLILGCICTLLGYQFLPKGTLNPGVKISFKEYLPILQSSKALTYIFCICFLVLGYWVFIGISPILYIEDLGVSLKDFGLYQGSMAIVFAVASFSSPYFLKKFGQKKCFIFSMVTLVFFTVCILLLILSNQANPLLITIAMQFLALGIIFPINILWPLSLEVIEGAKGRIAALIVGSRLLLTSAGLQTVSYFYQRNFTSLGISLLVMTLIMFWFCYRLYHKEKIFITNPVHTQ